VESAIATLKKPELLFGLPAAAKCGSVSVEVKSPLADHDEHEDEHAKEADHQHEHKDEHAKEDSHEHEEEVHSDIAGHYKFSCAEISQLQSIEIGIFKQFPGTEEIEAQTIS
jgi:ABC-type Zn2+ transport system substrate-binding protein/surface adhesin